MRLPAASVFTSASSSLTAFHEPMSLQSNRAGTTARRDVRHRQERVAIEFDRAARAAGAGVTGARGGEHIGAMAPRGVQDRVGTEAEHAGIPQIVAGLEVRLGGGTVRFFDERQDFPSRG
jgi:hypothetical protein